MEEYSTEGEIHGYHVYKAIWTLVMDEVLECVREEDIVMKKIDMQLR